MLHLLFNRFPVSVRARNGDTLTVKRLSELLNISFFWAHQLRYDVSNDMLVIPNYRDGAEVRFKGALSDGDVRSVFLLEDYSFLRLSGAVVVDIGANIGDTSIWFALNGAKKVLAFEPFPQTYRKAQTNVILNNLSDTISLFPAACGERDGSMLITESQEPTGNALASTAESGIRIPVYSLSRIVHEFGIANGVLKIDCEGCEYAVIHGASQATLSAFRHIQIEYHQGIQNLSKVLASAGFRTRVRRIGKTLGFIYGWRELPEPE